MKTRPNIILINCDDLGYGDLGCYDSAKNNTPHIDALARGGMKLTDYYTVSAVCSASRAGLLTGCYPQRVGFGPHSVLFPGNPVGLDPRERTIAGQLKQAGYQTRIVGKWHCGDQPEFLPTRHGFDDYFGIPYSNDMGIQANRDSETNANRFCPLPLLRNETVIQEQPDQRGITERYTDEALHFIEANRDQPFFLYLAHLYVHVPLFVPKQFLEKSQNGAYGGAVECIDWSTGVIVDRLKQLGLLENTLIIFTSDNGSRARDEGGSNDPCRGRKGTTWEGGQRVPCILHWPEKIAPGSTLNDIARAIDLFPTLTTFADAGALPERPIDGVDLSGRILGEAEAVQNETMLYYLRERLEAVRCGDWKLHYAKGGFGGGHEDQQELYNLREDIGETQNLYEAHPEIVARLEEIAEAARVEFGDALQERQGRSCRPIGRVEDPKKLTEYREDHPYMIAMYDLPDMPTLSG